MNKTKKDLEILTIAKLKEIALKEKVDLSNSSKKSEIVDSIISKRNNIILKRKNDLRYKKLMSMNKEELINFSEKNGQNIDFSMTKEQIATRTYRHMDKIVPKKVVKTPAAKKENNSESSIILSKNLMEKNNDKQIKNKENNFENKDYSKFNSNKGWPSKKSLAATCIYILFSLILIVVMLLVVLIKVSHNGQSVHMYEVIGNLLHNKDALTGLDEYHNKLGLQILFLSSSAYLLSFVFGIVSLITLIVSLFRFKKTKSLTGAIIFAILFTLLIAFVVTSVILQNDSNKLDILSKWKYLDPNNNNFTNADLFIKK